MGASVLPITGAPLDSLKARLDAARQARQGGAAPAPADVPAPIVNLAHQLQILRQSRNARFQREASGMAPERAPSDATRVPVPVPSGQQREPSSEPYQILPGTPTLRLAIPEPGPATARAQPHKFMEADAAAANARTADLRAGKARAGLPLGFGAGAASAVERIVGNVLSNVPGPVGRFGEHEQQLGEEHARLETLGADALPLWRKLPVDIGNIWLELEAGGRLPGPLGRAIGGEGPATRIMGSLKTGELAAPGAAATAGRLATATGREAQRFAALQGTMAAAEGKPPEDVVTEALGGAAGGAAWGAGTQALREVVARAVGAAIRGARGPGIPARGQYLPPGPPPELSAAPEAPTSPTPEPGPPTVDVSNLKHEMVAGKYTDAELKTLRARMYAGLTPRTQPSVRAAATDVVDAIDTYLQGKGVAGAAPIEPQPEPGKAAAPGAALHDAEGNVIPGTEVTPQQQRIVDARAQMAGRDVEAALPERRGGTPLPAGQAERRVPGPKQIVQLPTAAIVADPSRFQFKELGSEGVSPELKGVTKWNPDLAGVISVWRDPADGKTYVVNGHHRLELAQRLGVPRVNAQYIDAPNAKMARAEGAYINIAEGRGTATDVGKFLRDMEQTPADLERRGVSLRGDIAKNGVALSKLAPDVFSRVAAAKVPESWGAAIGTELPEQPELQRATLKLAEESKTRLSGPEVRELAKQVKAAGTEGVNQETLFGAERGTAALFVPRAQLSAALQKNLAADKRLFSYVSKGARPEELGRAGRTQIDVGAARKMAEGSARLEEIFNRLSTRTGPLAQVLTEGARRIAHGEGTGAVARELYPAVRTAIEQELGGGLPKHEAGKGPGAGPDVGEHPPVKTEGSAADEIAREAAAGEAPVKDSTDKNQATLMEPRQLIAQAAKQIADAVSKALHPEQPPAPPPETGRLRYDALKSGSVQERANEHAITAFGSVAEAKRAAIEVVRSAGKDAQIDLFAPGRPVPMDPAAREAAVARAAAPRAWVSIKGQSPKTPEELHGLLWPFRSPQMERMHFVLFDAQGKVIEHQMHSSGSINSVQMQDDFAETMIADMKRTGAVEAAVAHNHPSGDPTASKDDIAFTGYLGVRLDNAGLKLRGQYVIDDVTGTWIQHEGDHYSLHKVAVPRGAETTDWTATHGGKVPGTGSLDVQSGQRVVTQNDMGVFALARTGVLPANRTDVLYFNTQNIIVALEPHVTTALQDARTWLPQRVKALAANYAVVVVGDDAEGFEYALRNLRDTEGVLDVFAAWQPKGEAFPRWVSAAAERGFQAGAMPSGVPPVSATRLFERPTGPRADVRAPLPSDPHLDLAKEPTEVLRGIARRAEAWARVEQDPVLKQRAEADLNAIRAEIDRRGSSPAPTPIKTADTMGEAIAQSSPSGQMSKRARAAAQERLRSQLFGKTGLQPAPHPARTPDDIRRYAAELRRLADGGMRPKAHRAEADRLDEEARQLENRNRVGEQEAFHGSPHRFERFQQDKIGTGQGAEGYGHGFYFAEVKGVARTYREQLAGEPEIANWVVGDLPALARGTPEGTEYIDYTPQRDTSLKGSAPASELARSTIMENLLAAEPAFREVASEPQALRRVALGIVQADLDEWKENWPEAVPEAERILESIKENGVAFDLGERGGAVYHVKLNVEPHEWLDWDRRLADQSPHVRAALHKLLGADWRGGWTGADLYRALAEPMTGRRRVDSVVGGVGSSRDAATVLRDLGIKGTRYLDQGSRNPATAIVEHFDEKPPAEARAAELRAEGYSSVEVTPRGKKWRVDANEKQTSNFVVFDAKDIGKATRVEERGPDYKLRPEDEGVQPSMFAGKEGTAASRSLVQTEAQARSDVARLRQEFAATTDPATKRRLAREIAQLEKLVNRDKALTPAELATQAAGVETPTAPAEPSQTTLFEQGAKYVPGALPVAERGVVDSFNRLLDPASRGPDAKAAARALRKAIGTMRRTLAVNREALKAASKIVPSLDTPEGLDFYDRAEGGTGQVDPKLNAAVKLIGELYAPLVKAIQDLGSGKLANPLENYMSHLWAKPEEAKRVMAQIASKRPMRGRAGFLKERTIPRLSDGIRAGLEPVTLNPVELNLLKMREMTKYLMGQHFLADGKAEGWAQYVPVSQPGPEGWTRIDDPTFAAWGRTDAGELVLRGHYWMPDGAAQVAKNYLSPGLRGNAIFDAYMGLGNTLNQFQLGASGFHAGFSTMTAAVSRTALSIGKLRTLHQPFLRPSKAGVVGGAVGGLAGLVFAGPAGGALGALSGSTAARFLADGLALKRAYLHPGSGNLVQQRMAEMLEHAGGQVTMDPTFKYDALGALKKAAKDRNIPAGLAHTIGAVMQGLAWPTMEFYVPLIKLGAFSQMMQHELAAMKPEAGELFTTDAQVDEAAQRIWHSVDNRFGQVSYDTRFWNNAVKQGMMATVRAVGWDAGSVDELVGGLKDGLKGKGSRRFDFLIGLVLTTAFLNILTQLALTGEGPTSIQDVFEPRDGTTDEDGNANRLSPATYMKDILAFGLHPILTIEHKLHPVLTFLDGLLVSNKNFYGDEIRHPGDPIGEQLKQVLKYLRDEFTPLSVRNINEAERRGTSGARAVLPMVGWSPASREAERSSAQNLMNRYMQASGPSTRSPAEVAEATTRRDVEQKFRRREMGYSEARQALVAAGLRREQIEDALRHMMANPLVERFKGLTLDQAREVYNLGTPREQALWRPALFRKIAETHPRNPPQAPRPPSRR